MDRWILSRLQHVVSEVDENFERFEFAKVCDALYHFAWDDVCDWYVELAKPVLAAGGAGADVTRRVLGHVLDQLLRLLHPVIPFVTDELWSALTGEETLVRGAWPAVDAAYIDDRAEALLAALQAVVTEVRRFRSDQGLKPGQRVASRLTGLDRVGLEPVRAVDPLARPPRRPADALRRHRLAVGRRRRDRRARHPRHRSTSPPSGPGSRRTGPPRRRRPPSAGPSSTTRPSPTRRPSRSWRRSGSGWPPRRPTWPASTPPSPPSPDRPPARPGIEPPRGRSPITRVTPIARPR